MTLNLASETVDQGLPDPDAPDVTTGTGADAGETIGVVPEPPSPPQTSDESERWLDWQCRMVSGVRRGAVFLWWGKDNGGLQQVALWPRAGAPDPALQTFAERAIRQRDSVAKKEASDDGNGPQVNDYLAYPLFRGSHVIGAVVLATAIRSGSQREAVLQLLRWGVVWLEEALSRSAGQQREAATVMLDAIEAISNDAPLPVAGHELCNLLADRFECSLVALGLRRGLQVRVNAISHQLRFDSRLHRVAQIEFAMEECADRDDALVLPIDRSEEYGLSQAHQQLMRDSQAAAVCSVPLRINERLLGVLTLLRDQNRPFDKTTTELVNSLAGRIAPLLALREQEVQPAWRRIAKVVTGPLHRLVGPGHLRLKGLTALALIVGITAATVTTDHRVAARATVEGSSQQAIVAPFAGYLMEAGARAGDEVTSGQVLATLDERELQLEHEKLSGERDKHAKEYQEALAKRDRARVTMLSARIAQAEAQLAQVADQLQRTRLTAPFDGLLVSGDWSRSLGAPVERGQQLFEIVPASDYRIALQVDEHDVDYLVEGQAASLRLAGMPDSPIMLAISRILPVASAFEGANHFRVEAAIVDPTPGLRPGMQGVAKVTVGHDSLFNVWTAPLRDRLRLWAWSIGL